MKGDFRLARTGSTVGGVDIPAGSTIMVLNGAAGRDPRRFEEPDRFQMDRPNAKEHLAFGRGPHACPGGPLARAETRISIERLLARMGDIRISESAHGPVGNRHYEYVPTYILRGLTQLHLEFTPIGLTGSDVPAQDSRVLSAPITDAPNSATVSAGAKSVNQT